MFPARWPLVLVLLASLAASAACVSTPDSTPPERAFITIDANPPDSYVYLDGQPLGGAREVMGRAFFVERGKHTVVVVAPGYRPFRQDLLVQDATPHLVRTVLIPR